MKNKILTLLFALAPFMMQAQVNYVVDTNSGTAYVTNSATASGNVVIASTYNGYPVTVIANIAFSSASGLTTITIPNSITNIGTQAFDPCANLTSIAVVSDNPAYTSINGVLFDKAQTTLLRYPAGAPATTYTIPAGVRQVGAAAFDHDSILTSVVFPAGVTNLGNFAFRGCSNLKSAIFLGNAPTLGLNDPFNNLSLTVYYYAGTSGWGATYDGFPTVMIPQINIAVVNGQSVIYWPASSLTFTPQITTNLASPNWTDITNGAAITGIVITNRADNAYFRLRH